MFKVPKCVTINNNSMTPFSGSFIIMLCKSICHIKWTSNAKCVYKPHAKKTTHVSFAGTCNNMQQNHRKNVIIKKKGIRLLLL